MFDYRLEILVNAGEELPFIGQSGHPEGSDTYIYDNRYYGFTVKDVMVSSIPSDLSERVFVLSGTSTLEELKTMFNKLTNEVIESETPPPLFKSGMAMLQAILAQQDEKDFTDNAEYEISRNYPNFGIQLNLFKQPAPVKKDPAPDGYVTGSLWRVALKFVPKTTKVTPLSFDEDIYCIKPESAVHEAVLHVLRHYSGIKDYYTLETPINVRKITDTIRLPYIIVKEKE